MVFKKLYAFLKKKQVFVHILMFSGVFMYALLGGLILMRLEKKPVNITSVKGVARRSVEVEKNLNTMEPLLVKELELKEIHQCVQEKLLSMTKNKCSDEMASMQNAIFIEDCYKTYQERQKTIRHNQVEYFIDEGYYKNPNHPWTFIDSLLFTFTVITTIGYGYVAPQTFWGRIFCIFYGFLGIPITIIAIADLGKFISEILDSSERKVGNIIIKIKELMSRRESKASMYMINSDTHDSEETVKLNDNPDSKIEEISEEKSQAQRKAEAIQEEFNHHKRAIQFLMLFVIYLFLGAFLIAYYEPDMDFFKALYFNFISLTSIGLGDVYPRNNTYLLITIAYISVGLALCTIAFEIVAIYLRKIHYFGRKIEKVGNVVIWLGGKKLTMKQLIKNMAEQFNLPLSAIKALDIDKFVEDAIKVENGDLETLRTNPLGPEHVHIELEPYADEDDDGTIKWSFRIKYKEI